MRQILLIIIGLSSLTVAQEAPQFTKANGVVTDSKTTLEWQDDYSDNGGNIKSATWADAIDYCEALSLNGKDDWRLPNKNELLSIVDYGRYHPAISPVFENTISDGNYWMSTTYAVSTDDAWSIFFWYGLTDFGNKNDNNYVRCVRAGQ